MGRGLPKLYKWDERSQWKVKGYFDDPEVIRARAKEKEVLKSYAAKELPEGARVVVFTWVMEDGWGDYYTQLEAAKILKNAFPTLHLTLITLIHKNRRVPEGRKIENHFIFKYTGKAREELVYEEFSEQAYADLERANVFLQLPTYFPKTELLFKKLKTKPQHLLIGEYGFIDSAWFHPKTSAHCMGLHFLEKGIMVKTIPERPIVSHFNLDYTKTARGNYLFLHILLKALEKEEQPITIATPSLTLYIENLEKGLQELLRRLGIKELILQFKSFICPIAIQEKGKQLIVKHLEHLQHEEFLGLFSQTDQLVGCTGDGSIAEALSLGKPFLYDPPLHKRNFLKDLIAVAEEHLTNYPETVLFLKLSLKNSHLILEDVIDGWVSEEFLLIEEEQTSPEDTRDETIAERMGELLQLPRTKEGFIELGKIIRKDYAVNDTLCHLIVRAFAVSEDG